MVSGKLRKLIPDDPKEIIYIFTVSSNGIMRFHPYGSLSRKLWHGYGDSETVAAFAENIAHAGTYGCFCFGVIYKEKENYEDKVTGEHRAGGRTIVMRYNRWATDNAPIYAMVRQREDQRDVSIPVQPTFTEYYERKMLVALHVARQDDPRFDFGPALATRCTTCNHLTLNRGDEKTKEVYCIPCYKKHKAWTAENEF